MYSKTKTALCVMLVISLFFAVFTSCNNRTPKEEIKPSEGSSMEDTVSSDVSSEPESSEVSSSPIVDDNGISSDDYGSGYVEDEEIEQPDMPVDLGSGTTYYISASAGNDSNDGKSREKPFKTAAPVNKLSLYPGDNILLKRGDVFKGFHLKPLGSGDYENDNYIMIDAYGKGARPLLQDAAEFLPAISLSAMPTAEGYKIRNLDIDNYLLGIVSRKSGLATPFRGLYMENMKFTNLTDGKGFPGINGTKPESANLSWGFLFEFLEDAYITNIMTDNCDCPGYVIGSDVTIDNLYAFNSIVQGLMLYSFPDYIKIEPGIPDPVFKGNITVQNSKIINVGRAGFFLGTCGIILCNTRDSTIRNCEIAYVSNTGFAHDACAIDWETYNINCLIENVYAHDNEGPFLLAMEHVDTLGKSTGGVIKNCLSINNGYRDSFLDSSFMNLLDHSGAHQKITVDNCIDIGVPGSMPLLDQDAAGNRKLMSMSMSKLILNRFTTSTANVYEMFDGGGFDSFTGAAGCSISDSHLKMANGAALRTKYTGSKYITNTYMKGKADLVFYAPDAQNGYIWKFEKNKIIANKLVNGKLVKIKDIAMKNFDPNNWFRVRMEQNGEQIYTYIDEKKVDTLVDNTFREGHMGYNATGEAYADMLMIYRYSNTNRKLVNLPILNLAPGGNLSPVGAAWWEADSGWTAMGNMMYNFIPFNKAQAIISGAGAYIERKNMNCTVDGGYDKVNLVLMNFTASDTLTLEWTNNGTTWNSKDVKIQHVSQSVYPFNRVVSPLRFYQVNMAGSPGWSGTVKGFRVKFNTSNGSMVFGNINISK